MKKMSILGITLCVMGAVLLTLGYRASEAPLERLAESFTGRYSDQTMFYVIAGAAMLVGGGLLIMRGERRK